MFISRSGRIAAIAAGTVGAGAGAGTFTVTKSCFTPALLSTVTAFTILPLLPCTFITTSIGPPALGPKCQGRDGSLATVHPHEVRTAFTSTSEELTLVNQNVNDTLASPAPAFFSLLSASQTIEFGGRAGAAGTTEGAQAGAGGDDDGRTGWGRTGDGDIPCAGIAGPPEAGSNDEPTDG
jgi:hypothetical protein